MTVIGTKPRCVPTGENGHTHIHSPFCHSDNSLWYTCSTTISIATETIFYHFVRYSISSARLFIKYECLTIHETNNAIQFVTYFFRNRGTALPHCRHATCNTHAEFSGIFLCLYSLLPTGSLYRSYSTLYEFSLNEKVSEHFENHFRVWFPF